MWRRAERPKVCRLALEQTLCAIVTTKLRLDWSPEQIAGWLKREYPGDAHMHLSHETIYRTLYVQARGALKRELLAHLRQRIRCGGVAATRRRANRAGRSLEPRADCGPASERGGSRRPGALGKAISWPAPRTRTLRRSSSASRASSN